MNFCRLKNVTFVFCVCIEISFLTFGQTFSIEQKDTLAMVVLSSVAFTSVGLMPKRSIVTVPFVLAYVSDDAMVRAVSERAEVKEISRASFQIIPGYRQAAVT